MSFQSGEIQEDSESSTRSDRLSAASSGSSGLIGLLNMLSGLLANAGLIIFLLLIFACGFVIGGTALHDPDTCWLVATGRYICDHVQIPTTDPFSYTFAQLNRPWIVYQWLTEVCFYGAVRLGGLTALLCLVSFLVVSAFVALPLRGFARAGAFLGSALLFIAVAVLAASFHFLARPEIFSYLFGSAFLYLLAFHRLRLDTSQSERGESTPQPADWKVAAALALIMVVWVNFHTGFISAFVVLSLYCVVSLCARLLCGVSPRLDKTAWLALVLCLCVSFLNPFGIGLWKYIPQLFFAKFNPMIAELKPISALGMAAVPFIILVIGILVTWARRFFLLVKKTKDSQNKSNSELAAMAVSLAIIVVVSLEACKHQRVIPFAVLALIYEYLWLVGKKKSASDLPSQEPRKLFAAALQERFSRGLLPGLAAGGLRFGLFIVVLGIFGTLVTASSIQPILPQSSSAFSAPFAALEKVSALSKESPGNLFNDAQFGDCLIWYHPGDPKVFIDTRYDMYGEEFINDYVQIFSLGQQHPELLRKYEIKYVFARTDSALIKALSERQTSKRLYQDKAATIIQLPEGGI